MQVETLSWIASYPKSGNTWLRLLVSAYFQNGHVDINESPHTTGDNLTYWLQSVSPLPVDALTLEQMFLLRPAALFNQLCANASPRTFIKTHHANHKVGNGPPLIPAELTRRAIYIVRDPRDVALSLARYLDKDVAHAVEKMNDGSYALMNSGAMPHVLGSWSSHVLSWINEKRWPVHIVRYEDLCANPITTFMAVLDFCGIEVDADLVQRCVDACELSKLQKQERQNGFREDQNAKADRPFFGKGGTQWEASMPYRLQRQIESTHGEVMRRFGYLQPYEVRTAHGD